jgi:hypothetical protein
MRRFQPGVQQPGFLIVAFEHAKAPSQALRLVDRLRKLIEPACPFACGGLISGTMQIETPRARRTKHRPLPADCDFVRFGPEIGLTFLHSARYCRTRSVACRGV